MPKYVQMLTSNLTSTKYQLTNHHCLGHQFIEVKEIIEFLKRSSNPIFIIGGEHHQNSKFIIQVIIIHDVF